jgi:hypothetical protein
MRGWLAIRWLPLAAPAFAAATSAQTEPTLTYRQIRDLPPSEVAARLLRPDQAANLERIETQPNWGMLPGALQVRFFHRPIPVGRGYCSQLRQEVVLFTTPPSRDVPDDAALRVQNSNEYSALARAPGCRLREGQQFASFGVDMDVAMRALDSLAEAQAVAAEHGRLPFRFGCRDDVERDPDQCRPSARVALANLPLQLACSVEPDDDDDPGVVVITLCPQMSQWTVTMRDFGTRRARLAIL